MGWNHLGGDHKDRNVSSKVNGDQSKELRIESHLAFILTGQVGMKQQNVSKMPPQYNRATSLIPLICHPSVSHSV